MWKDPLIRAVECDIGTMEEKMRNIIKHIIKDDLLTCFLDSVILHHRLNKVCRELDVLGIEDNILKSLNMWNFVNEQDCSLDCNCFKYVIIYEIFYQKVIIEYDKYQWLI